MIERELDPATLTRYAEGCLTRPGDWYSRWEPAYTTHGMVHAWADRGDDIVAASNHAYMLHVCTAAAEADPTHQARWDATGEHDVVDGGSSHWVSGSLAELYVRVYTDDTRIQYTAAFLAAAQCLRSLADYPLLDEDDVSQREYEAWLSLVDDEIRVVAWGMDAGEREATEGLFWWLRREEEPEGLEYGIEGTPDPDTVREFWERAHQQYLQGHRA